MSTTHLDTAALVSAYAAGESASALARRYGISVWAVLKRVRDAGVRVRSVKEQCEKRLGSPTTDAYTFRNLVDGLLLGDAYVDRKGLLHLEQSDVRFGWVEQVASLLAAVGAESRIIPIPPKIKEIEGRVVQGKSAHVLYTPAYVEMQGERRRWYPDGMKVIPRDLLLTPTSLAHWFCGDGTFSQDGSLDFCTNGFTEEDVTFLSERLLHDLGIVSNLAKTPRPGQFKVQVARRDEAVKVRDIVEPLLPACCLYKLRHVRPTVPVDQHHQRRLTDDQVRDLRARRAAGEKYVDLAKRFGVSTSAVGSIVRGKAYTWLDRVQPPKGNT